MQSPFHPSPSRTILGVLSAIACAFAFGAQAATDPNSDAATNAGAGQDTSSALVQLQLDPLSTAAKTKPPQGKKIDFDSSIVKSYRAQLSAARNDYKQWLHANVPQAKVTGEFDISLNAVAVQLNGATLAQVSATPLVKTAQYEGLYHPTADDPDLALIRAPQAWSTAGGPANAGAGVKVAIVDTGIDITHPCFSDAGYAPQSQLGDRRFTNNKVIVAKVFNNKTPSRGYTAEALQEHGTHVSGTVACNYQTPATVDGVTIPYGISGVAPRALLGNYNIFPGDVLDARSEDILDALEAAYADGFDVANMSLGGGSHGIQDLLTVAIDNLDAADMVVAVAAGNSGPGLFTVESPGSGKSALAAGAASVGHLVAPSVMSKGGSFPALTGEFATVSADLTDTLAAVPGTTNGLSTACSAITANLANKIALVSRGTCAFSVKVRNAQAAGAVAVLVANNIGGDGIAMATDGTPNQPTIPAYGVSLADGQALRADDGLAATITKAEQYFTTGNSDIMASFSSQGPTDVDFRVKPDVVAPGVNVLSSIPHAFCATPPCFAFFQGTSMATPHLAGSAAFLRGQHPDWSAADIRSAIVNTAVRGVLRRTTNPAQLETNVNIVGAGREDLANAAAATIAMSPVSVSFGAVPSGSGDARTSDVVLHNIGSLSATLRLSITPGDASVAYSLSTASVTLSPGASTIVTVNMVPAKGAAIGGHQATLDVTSGGASVAHAAVYTLVK